MGSIESMHGGPAIQAVTRVRRHAPGASNADEDRDKPGGPRHQIDPAMPQELPVLQLSHVLIGTIVWWLESDKSYTPRQMATWFYRFAFYDYLAARGYEAPPPGKE